MNGLVRALFVVVLFVLATMGGLELRSLRRVVNAAHWVEHTLTVEKELGALLASLLDAGMEYGELVRSGSADSLHRIQVADAASSAHLDRIQMLTVDNADQQARLVDLRRSVDRRIAFVAELMAARLESPEAARVLFASGEGARRLRATRNVLEAMTREEERLLSQRNQLAISNATTANQIAISMCLTVLVMIGVGYVLIRNNLSFIRTANAHLREAEILAARLAERKRAEETALRLAAIVTTSSDAIIGKSLDGLVTSWNRGAEKLFGYEAEEIMGRSVTVLFPPGRESEEQTILEHLRRGEPIDQFETVRQRKDGRTIDVSVTLSPIVAASGEILGASKVARDIGRQKRSEAALTIANQELESFSYSVAHDLRAPLRGMNGFARILLDDYAEKLDAEGRDCLQEIHQNAVRMAALVDALLSLSRITRTDLKSERTNLSELAHTVATRLATASPRHNVEVVIAEGLFADVDRDLCHNLLQNLLGNAWKFTGQTAHPRVELGSFEQDGSKVFFVRDNGAGFDMAYASKLFVPFQRLHSVGEFPGTGIGLATVRRIVHRHHGRIWAEGSVDTGATFLFTLPDQHLGESP